MLFGGPGAVYTFQGLDGLFGFSVPAPSTSLSPQLYIIDYFGDAHVDAQHFVYIDDNRDLADPTGGLHVCPAGGCVGSRGPTLLPRPLRLLAFANDAAFTSSGADRATASIVGCAIAGCGGAGTVLATNQAYVGDIVADDKDVYWATVGAPDATTNSAPVGTIMRCALPSCAGDPQRSPTSSSTPSVSSSTTNTSTGPPTEPARARTERSLADVAGALRYFQVTPTRLRRPAVPADRLRAPYHGRRVVVALAAWRVLLVFRLALP